MAYPQQGYFVQAPMPQPQRFFNQAQANVRGAQPRWPQQPRGAIPPGQMQMGMNAGFRTRGPSGPRMNQAQAAAAAAMAARPMAQQMMPAMMRGVGQIPPHLAAAAAQNPAMVAVNQQAAIAQAAAQQAAAQAVAANKQNAPRANYKYAPGVRNPAQVMAMGGHNQFHNSNHNLQYLFKGRNHLQHLCWLLHHHKNKSRCWVNACSLLSKECILNWQERLLACCWKLTILNWFTCWKTDSLSKERWMRPLLFFKLINPNQMNNYNEKRHQIRGYRLTKFQKIVPKRNF